MKNGDHVRAFEKAFADYVGARYAIALCNGTATLHTALDAVEAVLEPAMEDRDAQVDIGETEVAVPPLTMSATTLAVLHAGAVPRFVDVDPDTWLMPVTGRGLKLPVSLYGLNARYPTLPDMVVVDDAAQTLRKHSGCAFTSYSFQASKILPLGEGGMLVTDHEELATKAREFSSLGYRMRADQPRIDPEKLKHPTFARHYALGWNYRMSDIVAEAGLRSIDCIGRAMYLPRGAALDVRLQRRRNAAAFYRAAHDGCSWLRAQAVPTGWTHDYWAYAVVNEGPLTWEAFASGIERHGGERPYAAWRLTFNEPMFWGWTDVCPVAEYLQPRIVQFQTNDENDAERNAEALARVIREVEGTR